jgi:ribosome-dependent ATPase
MSLKITGLTKKFGEQVALNDININIAKNEIIGLLGPNGAGKSTLMKSITGVLKIDEGEILFNEKNISENEIESKKKIGFLPENNPLYNEMYVKEYLQFVANLHNIKKERIDQVIDLVGITPEKSKKIGQLSKGYKQRVGLAQAILHEPDLLILDEPTTGVDPLSRRQFWTLVESLRRERPGMTVIVATAYMEEAERFDYLVAMNDGQILVFDQTDAVLQRTPAHTLEAAFIDMLPPEQRGNTDALVIPAHRPSDGTYAIEATGLTRRFGNFVAVRDVNFAIERGEIFGFLGSNGCGKTTTMKMLTGLLDISSGEAKLLGKPIDPKDLKTRLKVGYMSQAFSLYEELTVQQNLMLHAKIYGLEGDAATNAVKNGLTHFELIEHAESRPLSMSLGMRQRLQLAAACLHRPELLILDEPTSGVDPAARDIFDKAIPRGSSHNFHFDPLHE